MKIRRRYLVSSLLLLPVAGSLLFLYWRSTRPQAILTSSLPPKEKGRLLLPYFRRGMTDKEMEGWFGAEVLVVPEQVWTKSGVFATHHVKLYREYGLSLTFEPGGGLVSWHHDSYEEDLDSPWWEQLFRF